AAEPFAGRSTASFVEEKGPASLSPNVLRLDISDIGFHIDTTDIDSKQLIEHGKLVVKGSLEKGVAIDLSVTDNELSIQINPTEDTPRAEFIASTFHALLGVAGEGMVYITVGGRYLRCRGFDISLKTISQMLQSRQVAYRLMVIERAARVAFDLPPQYSG